uniref:Uncharacterized protein n=2 Tax=Bacteria TaxID=2 RepID=A0A7C9JEY9_9BACT
MRFGRFYRLAGPGIYFTIPIVESEAAKVDQRVRTMNLVYDSVRENGSMVVVPSAYSEGFTETAANAAQAARDLGR